MLSIAMVVHRCHLTASMVISVDCILCVSTFGFRGVGTQFLQVPVTYFRERGSQYGDIIL